jgi:hypothetical protein
MHFYSAFGLTLHADIFFPELFSASGSPDVVIQRGVISEGHSGPNTVFLNLPTIAKFLIEAGNRVTYDPATCVSDESLRLFILGSCMGAILHQRGYIVIHGNAISLDGKTCQIFVGHSGAGKSTTAAWYYQQGATILADDICAIGYDNDSNPIVIPSYPQLKLWQSSATLLDIDTRSLRRVRPEDAKFALPIHTQFQPTPLPLTKITEIHSKECTTESVRGIEKITLLTTHTYRAYFLRRMKKMNSYTKVLILLSQKVEMSRERRPVIFYKKA